MALPGLFYEGHVKSDDLETRSGIHNEHGITEGIDDHALPAVGYMSSPVAPVDAHHENLVLQGPGVEGNPPEPDIFPCPCARHEKDPGPAERKSAGLFRKFCIETDQDT